MRKILVALALFSAPLSGCAHLTTSPAAIASQTKVDEQIIVTAEQGYKAFRLAVEVGVQANLIHGPRAAQLQDLDNKLYTALGVMEAAYTAGNSADLSAAVANFNAFLTQANTLTQGKD